MNFRNLTFAATVAAGLMAMPLMADTDITWTLVGNGPDNGIMYGDGTEVNGSFVYDATTGTIVSNTISTTYTGSPGPEVIPATSTWYADPYSPVSASATGGQELLFVNEDPSVDTDLTGALYFSMYTATSDGYTGADFPAQTSSPQTWNVMLNDDNNGFTGPTYAGTCGDAACDVNTTADGQLTTDINDNQGSDAALAMSSCDTNPDDPNYTCTLGAGPAYLTTTIPAAPAPPPSGTGTPEPATFALFGSALVAIGIGRRKFASTKN